MPDTIFSIAKGTIPVIATAIHNGHSVRDEVRIQFALDEGIQLREEDPFTEEFAKVSESRIIGLRSRFEVDLNRPREKAVYRTPEDAWGIHVWKSLPSNELMSRSLEEYDAFYSAMDDYFDDVHARHGRFVVYDIHSYNHRRGGSDAPEDSPEENPELIVGTGNMNREYWSGLVEGFMRDMRSGDYLGHSLDVRENIRFRGGNFSRHLYERYGNDICVLALEFKKIFMDEWTGIPFPDKIAALRSMLAATLPGVLQELKKA